MCLWKKHSICTRVMKRFVPADNFENGILQQIVSGGYVISIRLDLIQLGRLPRPISAFFRRKICLGPGNCLLDVFPTGHGIVSQSALLFFAIFQFMLRVHVVFLIALRRISMRRCFCWLTGSFSWQTSMSLSAKPRNKMPVAVLPGYERARHSS